MAVRHRRRALRGGVPRQRAGVGPERLGQLPPDLGEVPLPAYLVFAVAALALLARKRHPVLVFAVVLSCSAVAVTLDYGHVGVASLVSLYAVGRYCSGFWANAGVLGAALAFALVDALTAERHGRGRRRRGPRGVPPLVRRPPGAASRRGRRAARPRAGRPGEPGRWPRSGPGSPASCTTSSRTGQPDDRPGRGGRDRRRPRPGAGRAGAWPPSSGPAARRSASCGACSRVLRPDESGDELGPQPGLGDLEHARRRSRARPGSTSRSRQTRRQPTCRHGSTCPRTASCRRR